MVTRKFTFKMIRYVNNRRVFVLLEQVGADNVIRMEWPKSGYSRESALSRADRAVGQHIREQGACAVTYEVEMEGQLI